MISDLRPFLRIQSDAWLIALRDKLSEDLLSNSRTTSFSYTGKAGAQELQVPTADLANHLADVLSEKNIEGAGARAATRMTIARFA